MVCAARPGACPSPTRRPSSSAAADDPGPRQPCPGPRPWRYCGRRRCRPGKKRKQGKGGVSRRVRWRVDRPAAGQEQLTKRSNALSSQPSSLSSSSSNQMPGTPRPLPTSTRTASHSLPASKLPTTESSPTSEAPPSVAMWKTADSGRCVAPANEPSSSGALCWPNLIALEPRIAVRICERMPISYPPEQSVPRPTWRRSASRSHQQPCAGSRKEARAP